MIIRKTIIFQGSRRSNISSGGGGGGGGGPTFSRACHSVETYRSYDFPEGGGGSGDPCMMHLGINYQKLMTVYPRP